MQKFNIVQSKVIALDVKDVDTDMIIPAQYMTSTGQNGYGQFLFQRLGENDADFPFNLKSLKHAKILLAKENFGCGSSREHAVWALLDWGIRVVIAPSFADIFYSNSAKNGLLLIQLKEVEVEKLFQFVSQDLDKNQILINLKNQKLSLKHSDKTIEEIGFAYDAFRKDCLLNGYDDLKYIQKFSNEIEAWDKNQQKHVFFNLI